MTTEDDLRARREAALAETRRTEWEQARLRMTGALIGRAGPIPEDHGRWLFPTALQEDVALLLGMCGLLGDPVDDGTPVVLPHPFDQPAAILSAPVAGTYR